MVPLDKEYAPSGSGAVSHWNMEYFGYSGFEFRKLNAFPELRVVNDPLVRQAWPIGLLTPGLFDCVEESAEPLYVSESIKCAPENCALRRSVHYFNKPLDDFQAWHPPRNMLNAKYRRVREMRQFGNQRRPVKSLHFH